MKANHIFYLFCFFILVNGNCLFAKPEFNASILASHVLEILEYSPELSVKKAEIEKLSGDKIQAGLYPNPTLGIEYDKFAGNRKFSGTGQIETGIKLKQPVITAGKLSKTVKIAGLNEKIAFAKFDLKRRMVKIRVLQKLVELDALEKQATLAKENFELICRYAEAVDKKESSGEVPEIEKLQAQIKVSSAKTRFGKLNREIARKKREIAVETKKADFLTRRFCFPETEYMLFDKVSGNLESMIDDYPGVVVARLEKRRAEREVGLALAQRTPNLELELGVTRERNDRQHFYSAGISFELPFFNRNQGNSKAAEAELEKSALKLSQAQLIANNHLLKLKDDLESAGDEKMQMLGFVLPEAQLMLNQVVKSQSYGETDLLTVLDARIALLQVKHDYYRIQADELGSFLEILTVFGKDLEVFSALSLLEKGDL